MSGKEKAEALGLLAVVAGLVFVGLEIQQNNRLAQAAAYQAIGIATSEWHRDVDARLNRLFTEARYVESIGRWTLEDWEAYARGTTSDLRLLETILLQVEQDVLPPDAMQRLGYDWGAILSVPGFSCLWPYTSTDLGSSVRELIEASTPGTERFDCHIDIDALTEFTILGEAAR